MSQLSLVEKETILRREFLRRTTITDYKQGYLSAPFINQENIDPTLLGFIANMIKDHFEGKGLTHCMPIPTLGFFIGIITGYEMNLPMIPGRKDGRIPGGWEKRIIFDEEVSSPTTGKSAIFEYNGDVNGAHILLVDDFFSSADTFMAHHKYLTARGARVSLGCAVSKRFEEGYSKLLEHSVDYFFALEVESLTPNGQIILTPPHYAS